MSDTTWVLVTGATSGIGRATALELMRRGHNVVMACRNTAFAMAVEHEAAQARYPGGSTIEAVDMRDPGSISALVSTMKGKSITLSGVINNAGVCRSRLNLSTMGIEETLATNAIGPHALSTRCLDQRLIARGGKIINVASHILPPRLDRRRIEGVSGFSMRGSYMQSKLALVLLANGLAERVSKDACQILSVFPGVVSTNLGRETLIAKVLGAVFDPFIDGPATAANTICDLYESTSDQHGQVYYKTRPASVRYVGDRETDTAWLLGYVEQHLGRLTA